MSRVILLHGLGRSPLSMRRMARRLERAGWTVEVPDYPSTDATVAELVDHLAPRLPGERRLHFVGHSLGGILAKHLMRRLPEERRGRIVQLGSPNAGSELASRVSVLEPVLGPVLPELSPAPAPDDADLEIGAIAGTAAHPAYGYLTGIPGENDGKVSVASAFASAREDCRLALPISHSLMTLDGDVIEAVARFLETGRFAP